MKPVRVQNAHVLLEPLVGSVSAERAERMIKDVYKLFSDAKVVGRYPEKRINSEQEASDWLSRTVMGYQAGTSYNHLIYLKSTLEVIGVIEVNTSKTLEKLPSRKGLFTQLPQLIGCIEVEYWLASRYWNQKVMSGLLKAFTDNILQQSIPAVTAFVEADNLASIKVLNKSGFRKVGELRGKGSNNTYHFVKGQ